MTTTFYRTTDYSAEIDHVAVERFNEVSVWIRGRRSARNAAFEKFWTTREEAVLFLIEREERSLVLAKRAVEKAEGRLAVLGRELRK